MVTVRLTYTTKVNLHDQGLAKTQGHGNGQDHSNRHPGIVSP